MTFLLWHELKEWLSHPIRLCLLDGTERTCYGILRAVTYTHCTVDLSDALSTFTAGEVRVEILSANHLLRFVAQAEVDRSDARQISVATPTEIEVIQRRQHPRISIDLPVWIRVLSPHEAAAAVLAPIPNGQAAHAHTMNLSAGGLAIRMKQPFSPGTRVKLTLAVDAQHMLTDLLAKVSRNQLQPDGEWIVALQFEQLSLEAVTILSQVVVRSTAAAASEEQFGRVLRTGGNG